MLKYIVAVAPKISKFGISVLYGIQFGLVITNFAYNIPLCVYMSKRRFLVSKSVIMSICSEIYGFSAFFVYSNATPLSSHDHNPVLVQCIDCLLPNLEPILAVYCTPEYVRSSCIKPLPLLKLKSSLFSVVREFIDDFPQISAFLGVDLAFFRVK